MYIFGIVVPDSDETPAGRAAAALRVQLPASFPEHRFEFLSSKDVEPEKVEELLFHVLGAGLIGADDEVVGEVPSHDLDQTVQGDDRRNRREGNC
jgi:hypothetical protein